MYRLNSFNLDDMVLCGADVRRFGLESYSVEETAEKVVRYFYDSFEAADGGHSLLKVGLFKKLRLDELDDELKRMAVANFDISSDCRFMTLMASAGDQPQWNGRRGPTNHRLVPLSNPAFLRNEMPILAHFIARMQAEATWQNEEPLLTDPGFSEMLLEPGQKGFNVLYIPEARDCLFFKDRSLVTEHGLRSIIAYGGMLNRGSYFIVALFSREFIPREAAEMFQPLALSTKTALIYANDFRSFATRREPA